MYCELRELLSKKYFGIVEFTQLANILDIDLTKMLQKKFCLEALMAKYLRLGEYLFSSLPIHYSTNQFSSTTSLSSILSQFKNDELTTFVLRKLQIPKEILGGHRPLSILAINDAIQILKNYSKNNEFFIGAKKNCLKFIDSDFGNSIKSETNLKSLYEVSFNNANLIEKSWDYKILKSSHRNISIRTEQTISINELDSYTNEETTFCRLQFIKNISNLCGYEGVEINNINQISQDALEFDVDFSGAKRIL
jgi:hypothetical protein